jgi:hypothetical protein
VADASDPIDLPTHAQDLVRMVIAYVKQETLDPIKDLKRFVALGLAAMVAMSVGLVLVFLGVLRLLQDETGDAFRGHLKFLPYLITVAFCGVVAVGALKARGRKTKETT